MLRNSNSRSGVHGDEWLSVVCAAAAFFCILASYYMLRPVRDEMAVRLGADQLKWLFTATFVAMTAVVPVFGFLASRVRRVPLVFGALAFFALHMLGFRAALQDASLAAHAAPVMFVWVSVFNLFVVSLFWSVMTDVFSLEQAERLFGPVAVGGTLGALCGPLLTSTLVARIGVPDLLLVSAGVLMAAGACVLLLDRVTRARGPRETPPPPALGGSAWEGLLLVIRSPYLLLFSAYVLLQSLAGTVLYFEQTRIVKDAFDTTEARTAFFAQVDLAVNAITAVTQLLGLAPLLHRFGLRLALAILPAVTALGFLALGLWPTLTILVTFGVLRRAMEYAVARPSREMLFTVLPRNVKYKAKNFLDTAVFRGSDAVSSWIVDAARTAGFAGSALAFAALPAALISLAIGVRLGRPVDARYEQESPPDDTRHSPSGSQAPVAPPRDGAGSGASRP